MKHFIARYGIIVLSILLLIAIFIPIKNYTIRLTQKMQQYLPNNLYINEIHIGNKTLAEAEKLLTIIEHEQLNKEITIIFNDDKGLYQAQSFRYEQLGYYADKAIITKDLEAIFNTEDNMFVRIWKYKSIENTGYKHTLKFILDKKKFMSALQIFSDSKLNPPKDAKYTYNNGKIEIIKEENGYMFDKEALYNELRADKRHSSVRLKTTLVAPKITAEQLGKQGVREKISSYMTKFDGGNLPRSSNIRLAASIIEGTVLAPGDTFSFNEAVGQRTTERGFKEAGVYINGKVDTGIGGGICQVSTTLYNAVLLADLQVLERYNHSLTVPYVPLSRDAAVSWGVQDLKFINNTDYHIYIHANTTKNSIIFDLFSTKSNKKVELISTTISKINAPIIYKEDEVLEVGKQIVEESGHHGFESQLTKKVYIDDKLVSIGIVSKDKYMTAAKIIIKGIKIPIQDTKYYFSLEE
ncbi:MAG: VanW family protein [Lutisporaceae bacterium]